MRSGTWAEHARHVLDIAQEESERFGHNYLGTEHLLLGLLRAPGLAAEVLAALGVELDAARRSVVEIIGRGPQSPTDVGLTPRAKRVIEHAAREARRLGDDELDAPHLLLGLLDEPEGVAAGIIERLGATTHQLRAEVLRRLASG